MQGAGGLLAEADCRGDVRGRITGGRHRAGGDQVGGEGVDDGAVGVAETSSAGLGDVVSPNQAEDDGVLDVPADIGNGVGQADYAALEGGRHQFKPGVLLLGLQAQVEFGKGGKRRRAQAAAVDLAVMAEDAVQGLEAQIPPPALAFQTVKETDRLDIVLKGGKSVLPAEAGEIDLAAVAEGGVADIVAEGDGLDQVLVEPEKTADGAGNPGHQLHMEDPVGDMVVVDQTEDLGLVDIAGVGPGVENAVGVEGELLAITLPIIVPAPDRLSAQGRGR